MTEDDADASVAPPGPLPTNSSDAPDPAGRRGAKTWLYLLTGVLLGVAGTVLVLNDGDGGSNEALPTLLPTIPTASTLDSETSATAQPERATVTAGETDPTVAEPTVTEPSAPSPTAVPEVEPTPEAGGSPIRLGALPADPDAGLPDDAPVDVADVAAQVASGEVPESRGILLGGRIFLVGAVPDQASADALAATAAEVLGADNVFNHYFIDPRAEDASFGNIRVDDHVLFETSSAVIAAEFEPVLNQALFLMSIRPEVTVVVVGHTDDQGGDDFNQTLSEERAAAVVAWLTQRGVAPERLTSEGRGETDPVAPNNTAEGRQANRRIQFFIENLS